MVATTWPWEQAVLSALQALATDRTSSAGTDRSVTASTTSQQLMASNASRKYFFIRNDSAIDVWVNLGATAAAAAGSGNLKVAANGGHLEINGASSAVNIIAASGTPAITAREF